MKIFTIVSLIIFSWSASAQNDKTLKWIMPQKGSALLTLDSASRKTGTNSYEIYPIVPKSLKTMHLSIRSTSGNRGGELSHPYILRVLTPGGALLNEIIEHQPEFQANFNLVSNDTVSLHFITHPLWGETVHFEINYTIGDTSKLSYAGKKPQEVFDIMLQLAGTGYMNMTHTNGWGQAELNYPQGLFAPFRAVRSSADQDVVQYTGEGLDKASANKVMAKWNSQVKEWLKDYDVSDVSIMKKGNPDQNNEEEETLYSKSNSKGELIFKVAVFKEIKGTSAAAGPTVYSTGVRIGIK